MQKESTWRSPESLTCSGAKSSKMQDPSQNHRMLVQELPVPTER